ncbi:MAG TPA: hypothetical protein VM864_03375 [Pyrinomonadaceae bacterium]|nr:hypothetical protein [Pyrinomonadaceae bacterium]
MRSNQHGITQLRQAVRLKLKLPSWGATRMKRDFRLALPEQALLRIWREQGLPKRKRRKHKTEQ